MRNRMRWVGLLSVLMLAAGCSYVTVRDNAVPSRTKDQYTRVKKVALLPLENYSDQKDAEKTVDSLMTTAIREAEIFDQVEDTRFVRDTMKKLKITNTDILEKEVVKKLGDEMNVQGILYGKVLFYGQGKTKDASMVATIDLSLVDPSTGVVLWVGNVTSYGGLTWGQVFGVTQGKLDIEVARDAVRKLINSMVSEVESAREREKKGIVAALKKEQDQEQARLEKLKAETGKIQGEIDSARAQAKSISDNAARSAEQVKADLELQKAALEAEKAKTQAAQQEIDQDKLKVEVERKKIEEEKKALEDTKKKAAEPPPAAPSPSPAPEPPPSATPPSATPPAGTPTQ